MNSEDILIAEINQPQEGEYCLTPLIGDAESCEIHGGSE